ncbi:PAS domain-containing protein [Chitiniphilus purpureus]|uniref:PAS domain-containing protein n=1 Tax=Chitiniphilus purpureus TaxID=2981137 RepID=A0ABY6DRH5_9NEIS|nr:PAS domain-containing protein [Chitiniphilus sp. CD1]UXY16970.1 PAS domain-containing protein [Chitiniphilus sp. CD1]
MVFKIPVNWRRLASVFVPGVLIVAISIYVLGFRSPQQPEHKVLPGKALAAYDDLYPIRADHAGTLYLDRARLIKAIDYFTVNPSPRAIADLIYLGNANNVTLLLDAKSKAKYLRLAEIPDYAALARLDQERDRIFQSYRDIVNGIGQTFAGTPMEFVLHDTRNPLRSIIAVQNPISGRRLGDTNTNFGLQLIKNYSYGEGGQGRGGSFVSYALTLKDGRPIKSTTIPIFHEVYGLIGFICINLDISKLDKANVSELEHFVENFKATIPNDAITEMIQNSKRKS